MHDSLVRSNECKLADGAGGTEAFPRSQLPTDSFASTATFELQRQGRRALAFTPERVRLTPYVDLCGPIDNQDGLVNLCWGNDRRGAPVPHRLPFVDPSARPCDKRADVPNAALSGAQRR